MNRKIGFTLAEVLIVLGIVGIVVEMTIIPLSKAFQNQVNLTKLKKTYSTFNQVLAQYALDKDCPNDLACTGLYASPASAATVGAELMKYLRVAKLCGSTSDTGCFPNALYPNYDSTGTISNPDSGTWAYYKFITEDGVAVRLGFDRVTFDCGKNNSNNITKHMTQVCGTIHFDVNGPTKGPNTKGRDYFQFNITNGRGPFLYPAGGADDSGYGWWKGGSGGCGNASIQGDKCAARIIEQNWQMNY